MSIQYIYIKDHFLFGNQNINFGGRFRFHYDAQNQELIVTRNPQFIENFFEPPGRQPGDASISQITALVGQNGVVFAYFNQCMRLTTANNKRHHNLYIHNFFCFFSLQRKEVALSKVIPL